jgi:hypothetical protein
VHFHDFHLEGYTVSKFGGEIVLDLVSDDSDETSKIRFADVAAYYFVHTGGGIILEITERSIAELIHQVGDQLAEWWRLHNGFQHWSDSREVHRDT